MQVIQGDVNEALRLMNMSKISLEDEDVQEQVQQDPVRDAFSKVRLPSLPAPPPPALARTPRRPRGSAGPCGGRQHPCVLQVRDHIVRTGTHEVSWKDLQTVCAGTDKEALRAMATEYAALDIWSIEQDANGHIRLLVEEMG